MKKVLVFLLTVTLVSLSLPKGPDQAEVYYKSALESYNRGSYYSALEDIEKVLPYQKHKLYKEALLLAARIYLEVGKKTGLKKYLWKANYYLNVYIQAGGKQSPEYYYTKAAVFERLGFFERAFTLYKMALMSGENGELSNQVILGLMRTAIMVGNLDAMSKYIIYLAPLNYSESKELTFLLGMKYFYEGNYKQALEMFKQVYEDFELYLLDNPDFYFYVGETAFLTGDYNLAKKIFRKIISQVKNDDVIRKSYLRLGDIAALEGDKNEAFNNYLTVINRFPETDENTVARLKMIALLEKFPEIKSKVLKVDKLQDPIKFVVKTMITNRTNYIGKYAIGNFGILVFKNPTEYLIQRLSWELSLMYPLILDPDQKRYIRTLWEPYLEKLKEDKLLMLYDSNPAFFKVVFDRKILGKISDTLDFKQEYINKNIDLLKYLIDKYNSDEDKRNLGFIYYRLGKLTEATATLNSIKEKSCQDEILIATLENKTPQKLSDECDVSKLPSEIRISYFSTLYRHKKEKQAVKQLQESLKTMKNNTLSKQAKEDISYIALELFKNKDYAGVVSLLEPVYSQFEKEKDRCNILSVFLISKVRISEFSSIEEIYDKINDCNQEISMVAKEVYKNYKLLKEVR